ncbi:uncharacterized protein LOC135119754 [Zophobas morio]|uniref:uncharacterized protein LOC135119754 n=1 Tax=Zophobas morio TaxID=2755281 RepID=UPI00308282C2
MLSVQGISLIKVPHGICDQVNSEAGYYPVGENKEYFYWFFESRADPLNDPVIIRAPELVVLWLNGGPGCSSEIGLFYENGPCRLKSNNKSTKVNPFSWNNKASIIYVDQPTGAGFSIGIAIGNGLTDPLVQYKSYCEYSLNNGYRMLSSLNVYNIKEKCYQPPLCYDFSGVENFLGSPLIREALGVGNASWESCNNHVSYNFREIYNFLGLLKTAWFFFNKLNFKSLLEENIRVLIYAGDLDYICNWIGNKEWTEKLMWRYAMRYRISPLEPWSGDGGAIKGEIKRAENLIFLRIYEAGHMVPMDQPETALLMFNQFMENTLDYN